MSAPDDDDGERWLERWLEAATDPERPGEPIWVDVRFVIHKLTRIDTVNGSAFIKIHCVKYWTDHRLIDWHGELPELLWGPVFNLSNSLGDMITTQDEFSLMDRTTGRLKRVHVYEGNIDNDMHLRDFPLDLDFIPITFTTMSRWRCNDSSRSGKSPKGKSYRIRKVQEPHEGSWLRLDAKVDIPEFTLHGMSTAIDEKAPNDAGSERTIIEVSFHVARNSAFYGWKVMLPVYLLTLLSFQVYAFHPAELEARVNTTATYFLAAFAMLYVVSGDLPKTDFLTSIDIVIVFTSLALATSGICSVILFLFIEYSTSGTKDERMDSAMVANVWIAIATIVVYVAAQFYLFIPVIHRKNGATKALQVNFPPIVEGAPEPTRFNTNDKHIDDSMRPSMVAKGHTYRTVAFLKASKKKSSAVTQNPVVANRDARSQSTEGLMKAQ